MEHERENEEELKRGEGILEWWGGRLTGSNERF